MRQEQSEYSNNSDNSNNNNNDLYIYMDINGQFTIAMSTYQRVSNNMSSK